MMHQCSGSSGSCGNPVVPCPCGLFHASGSSFCALLAMPTEESADHLGGGSVDCTLSLGTPSTRRNDEKVMGQQQPPPPSGSSAVSNFCWDAFQATHQEHTAAGGHQRNGRGGSSSSMHLNNLGGGNMLARRCANCDTTATPLWRNGPRGPKSLCNACGIRYKKEERRASSSLIELNNQHPAHYSWSNTAAPQRHKTAPSSAEFRLIRDDNDRSSADVPFISWRLNVRDKPAELFHDFT